MFNRSIFLLFCLCSTTVLLSQDLKVSGKVTDEETDEPLPAVSVLVKGTERGTLTDFEGTYEIDVASGETLVFTFVGMKKQEFTITSSQTLNVALKPDVEQLDAVTISTGYYNINKKDLSGSIAQVKSKELERQRTQTVEQMLQGQVAGVLISESAEPGGGIGISIRGTNSILGGTQPLYVIDGIPIDPVADAQGNNGSGGAQNSLGFLNPNDIEKIEILKDAAATAVYGARGANGVVLITTKTGGDSEGRDVLNLTVDTFVTEVREELDVMDGPTFESYMNQRSINQLYVNITDPGRPGGPFNGSQELNETNYPELATFELPYPTTSGVNTDWQDLVYRQAISSAYNLSYRGGSKGNNFLVSLGYQDTKGVIVNTDNQRITFNGNFRRKAFDNKIDIFSKTKIAYNQGNASSVGNGEIFRQRSVVSNTLQFQPIFTPLEPGQDDAVYAGLNEGNLISNPLTLATDVLDLKTNYNLIQNLAINAKVAPHLRAILKGGYSLQISNRDNYFPITTTRGRRNEGEATQAKRQYRKLYGEANLRYRNRFGKHRIDAVLVGTYENTYIRTVFNKAFGFGNDVTSFYNFNAATDVLVPQFNFREFGLLSGLFRVGYSYKRKFFLDVNARLDASSKFAENNKAAFFPSAAFAYNIKKEKFLRKSKTISDLKLRLSYGKTGSNPIPPYRSLALLEPIRYVFDGEIVTGFYETNLANDNLTWETTDQFNAGLDIGFKNSSINVTLDAYHKRTYDLLQNVILPASNGFETITDNFGEIVNKGFEVAIQAEAWTSADFTWNVSANFFLNRNELVSLNSNLDFQLGPNIGFAQTNPILFKAGSPLGIFWGARTEGIYESWEEAQASGIAGAAPGEIKYVNTNIDVDENGNPLEVQEINFDDYVQIGDPNPDFNVAISNNFTYKNWDMSMLVTAQKGGDIFWVDAWAIKGNQNSRNGLTSAFRDSWTAPLGVDDNGSVFFDPNLGNTSGVGNPAPLIDPGRRAIPSDRNIYDGSFIRLKNLNFGYTFSFKDKRSLRVYATGQNLLTWTNYPGYDPEITTFNKDPQRRGVDFGGYPGIRTFSIGLNFNY